jgi:hypothetical protein
LLENDSNTARAQDQTAQGSRPTRLTSMRSAPALLMP